MANYLFNSSDDYYYDIRQYGNYIVINGDENTLNELLTALGEGKRPNGLGWYKHGSSFKFANDGKKYDWYIRLVDRPSPQEVDTFLRQYLQPPKPKSEPQPAGTSGPRADESFLLEKLDRYEQSVEDLTQGFEEIKSELHASTAAQVEIRDFVEQGQTNFVALENARDELKQQEKKLEEAKQKINDLEQKNSDLQSRLDSRSSTAADSFRDENQTLSKALNSAKAKVKELTKDKRDLRIDRDYWKKLSEEVSERNGMLEEQHSQLPEAARETIPVRSPDVNLESVIGAVLPKLRLIRDSWDYLNFEDLNHDAVLRRLRSIVLDQQVPNSKAVQGADNWMELHIDRRNWRLYYCRKNNLVGDTIVAMIGKKHDQTQDIQWLSDNPPAVALKNEMALR